MRYKCVFNQDLKIEMVDADLMEAYTKQKELALKYSWLLRNTRAENWKTGRSHHSDSKHL